METFDYLWNVYAILFIIATILFILYVFGIINPDRSVVVKTEENNGRVDCDLEWDTSGNLSRFVCRKDNE